MDISNCPCLFSFFLFSSRPFAVCKFIWSSRLTYMSWHDTSCAASVLPLPYCWPSNGMPWMSLDANCLALDNCPPTRGRNLPHSPLKGERQCLLTTTFAALSASGEGASINSGNGFEGATPCARSVLAVSLAKGVRDVGRTCVPGVRANQSAALFQAVAWQKESPPR